MPNCWRRAACMPTSPGCSRPTAMAPILVTGGSGFIAAHAIARLLAAGPRRADHGAARRADVVLAMLAQAGVETGDRLLSNHADLTDDAGWAGHGCAGCWHVASPFPRPAAASRRVDRARARRFCACCARRAIYGGGGWC